MEYENFKNSTILIGPKAVGKSFLASAKEKNNESEYVLSADLLINMVAHKLAGTFHILEADEKFAETVKKYKQDFELNNLAPQVYEMAKIVQMPNISETSRHAILQFWKARFIENALKNLHQPVFIDASADFGAVFSLNEREQSEVNSFLGMHQKTLADKHKEFLKRFGTVVYLKPGLTYSESTEKRSHDTANQIFISNPESYSTFATLTLSADDHFEPSNNGTSPNEDKAKQLLAEIEASKNQSSYQ